MKTPKTIVKLIDSFQSLPGIGPKTAQRLTFHLLRFPQEYLERFAQALTDLKTQTMLCTACKNVGEDELCTICSDSSREHTKILVVANPMDVYAIEKTGYKGLYHVLHGLIDPLNGVGPEELFMSHLATRLNTMLNQTSSDLEVILATNTSMEGESTAMYLAKLLKENVFDVHRLKLTRIARGLPVGGDIEYADEITLSRALDGRISF